MVPGEEARLQLQDPVLCPTVCETGVARQTAFEQVFIEPLIAEGAECRRQATEGPDQSELRSDDVNEKTQLRRLRILEAVLGFPLHFRERTTRSQKARDHLMLAFDRLHSVATPVPLLH